MCLRQTCIVTSHSASSVKVVTSLYKWSSMYKNGRNENGQNINAIIRDRHDCVVYKRIARSSELSAGVVLRSSSIILEHVLYIVIVYYFRISRSKYMYKHVALAVLRYTECSKVNVHYRTRVYQSQIVHFTKKLSETCLYSIEACNYFN